MTSLRMLVSRLLDVVLASRRDRRLEEEITDHLDQLTRQFIRAGLKPAEARAAARRAFGNVDHVKENSRDQRGLPMIDAVIRDVGFAARLLRRNRGFAGAAILVLGLGIGVNNMLFTILNTHTLRGLPIADSSRVLFISTVDARGNARGISFAEFTNLRSSTRSFDGIAAFRAAPMVVAGDGHAPERLEGAFVTANAFDVIGVRPLAGRGFEPNDDGSGAGAVAILSRTAAITRYGDDGIAAVGRRVTINGASATVIGVMSDRSGFPGTAAVWMPLWQSPGLAEQRRDDRTLQAFGRVAPGAAVADAIAETVAISERLSREHPDTNRTVRARAEPINSRFLGRPTDPVWLAFMGVGFIVVLISCANVANLMLDRSVLRARELAIRASIGGTRGRLFQQLLAEGAVIAFCGATTGLLVALAGIRIFQLAIPADALPYWFDYAVDWRVLGALIGVSALTVFVFALLPAIQASRTDVIAALKDGGRSSMPRRRIWPTTFLAVQIALIVVLLAQLAVAVRTNRPDVASDDVLDNSAIITAAFMLPASVYPDAQARSTFYDHLLRRLRAVATIDAAALASALPYSGGDRRTVSINQKDHATNGSGPDTLAIQVTPGYFGALNLQMIQGRELDDSDGAAGREHVLVNEPFVEKYLRGGPVLGRQIGLSGPPPNATVRQVTIVGVAPGIRQRPSPEPEPVIYQPFMPAAAANSVLVLRSRLQLQEVVAIVREQVRALDAGLPIVRARTLPQVRHEALWLGRLSARLFLFLTFVAVALAAVGLYAVAAHGVSRERHEIGIRMALGARPRQVAARIVRRLLVQALIGFGVGVLCTFVWSWSFSSGDAAVQATDVRSLMIVGGILLAIVAVAAAVPARAAARLDPLSTIRSE